MKFFTSLKEHLPLYFATVAVVPLLVFGLSVSVMLEKQISEMAIIDLEAQTSEVTADLQGSLQMASTDLHLIANVVDQGLAEQSNQITVLLQTILNRSERLQSLFLLDANDRVLNLALPARLAAENQNYLGEVFPVTEYFGQSGFGDKESWSHTFPSPLTGEPTVFLAVPYGEGVLLASLTLRPIEMYEERIRQHQESADVAILDRDGLVIKHNRSDPVQQGQAPQNCPSVMRAIKTGTATPAHFHKETNLLECAQIVPETGWIVRVTLPEAVALAQVNQVRWLLWGASSGAVILGLLFTLWFSFRFLRPIASLVEATSEIAEGRYDLDIPSYSYPELNDFGRRFQKMGAAVKERESQLSRAQTLLSDLVNSVDGVVWEMETDARSYTFISQQAEQMFGYPLEQWTETPDFWQECIHPDDREYVAFRRFRHTTANLNHEVEYRIVTADSRVVWVRELVNVVLRKDQSQVLRGILIDITSQREAEQALRTEEKKSRLLSRQFQALLETIPYRIDLRDRSLNVLWSNRQHFSGEDRRMMPSCDFLCTASEQGTYEACEKCPTARCFSSAKREEGMLPGRENTMWHVRAFPVLDENGELRQVIQMIENVTEKVQKEQQEVRTGQLAALGELAAGVAHEINNPINGIINYAQLILNRSESETQQGDLAQRIIKEGDRVATIVRELLHFAREESAETHVVSIRDILEEILSLVGTQLHKEGVRLVSNLQEGLPCVESRSHQIEQTFLNVISNARHALSEKYAETDPDKILEVSAEQIVVDGRSLVRTVFLDHGPGMSPELLKRVLNPFVTTKPAGVGTGLGLSISYEILKNHDGTIKIDSQEGEYTRVTIDLPAKE